MKNRPAFSHASVHAAITAAALALPASSALASGNTAYLSATGSGSTCTSAAPCNSVTAALSVAGAEGEVICLNRGVYGGTIISQSVTISCPGGQWEAPFGIITVATPANSHVVIDGLVLDNAGLSGFSIRFIGQGRLELRNVRAGNLKGASANGVFVNTVGPSNLLISDSYFYEFGNHGMLVQPTSNSTVSVEVRDTVFSGNVAGAGIFVTPDAGSRANVSLDHVTLTANSFGLGVADGGAVSVRNSVFANNVNYGVIAYNASAPSTVDLTNSTISGTGSYGVLTAGSAAVSLSQMRIYGNGVGIYASSGSILSFGNNAINGNATDGSPTGGVALK